ncbi:uncharacterized protein LOC144136358 isoform X1 [Amblyomma americanum]
MCCGELQVQKRVRKKRPCAVLSRLNVVAVRRVREIAGVNVSEAQRTQSRPSSRKSVVPACPDISFTTNVTLEKPDEERRIRGKRTPKHIRDVLI